MDQTSYRDLTRKVSDHLATLRADKPDVKLGATQQEVEEALAVAVYMGGGPSLMYAAGAVEAFEEFSARASAR
jgi:alkylhydroperoxidase/carboxymuconolactone decarboxylase family protein YurZ